jgi:hypothetical protein
LIGRRELDQLHLVELVLSNQPADILAVRTGLAPETRRVGGVLDRQIAAVEDLAAMQVRQRHFGGRDEVQVPVAGDLEQVGFELRQVPGPDERCRIHHERRLHLAIAVLGSCAGRA